MAILVRELYETAEKIADCGGILHEMVVVQHQDEMLPDLVVDLVGQRDDQCLQIFFQRNRGIERRAGLRPERREAFRQSGNKIGHKTLGIAIEFVQRQPADGQLAVMSRVHQQGGLAIAGRGGDQNKFFIEEGIKQMEQARPREQILAAARQDDFGAAEWGGRGRFHACSHCDTYDPFLNNNQSPIILPQVRRGETNFAPLLFGPTAGSTPQPSSRTTPAQPPKWKAAAQDNPPRPASW